MAKRKAGKPKKPTPARLLGISERQYKNLKRDAENVRRRIAQFARRADATNFIIPARELYTLKALSERILNGESVAAIRKEIKKVTAENIAKAKPLRVKSETGYEIPAADVAALQRAVNNANRNIRAARKKFDKLGDVIPEEFSLPDIYRTMTGPTSVKNTINDLKLYTPKNLQPIAINDAGEAGTRAEYQRAKNIIERENERREAMREMQQPGKTESGYFVVQEEYNTRPVNMDMIPDLPSLRNRAEYYSDYNRVMRANFFLTKYTETLDDFQGALITGGMYNNRVGQRLDAIRDIIDKMWNNEELITIASTTIPGIDIALISDVIVGDVDFSEIYDAWGGFASAYISG